jgi:DNA-binding transcriptional regulator YiaG
MTAPDFRRRIAALGYSQRGFATYVGANERTVRRWVEGEQDIPHWVSVMLDLMEQQSSTVVAPGEN